MVGWHDPLKHQSNVEGERAKYWMSQGAKPSPTAWNLMVSSGVVEGAKISKHKKVQSPEPITNIKGSAVKKRVSSESALPRESGPEEKTEEGLEAEVSEVKEAKEIPSQEAEEPQVLTSE